VWRLFGFELLYAFTHADDGEGMCTIWYYLKAYHPGIVDTRIRETSDSRAFEIMEKLEPLCGKS
jgi:hypothetical protein